MIDNKLILENSKKLTVLYVEDNEEVCEGTKSLLETYFQHVDIAFDGQQGYEKYVAYHEEYNRYYDIIISDIKMPRLNGIEMCKKMKSLEHDQSIILVTAFQEPEYLYAAIDLGVAGFIQKPLDIQDFKKTLYKISQYLVDKQITTKYYEQIEELNLLHIDKIDARKYNAPQDIVNKLEDNKELISHKWCENTIVQERLMKHEIDVEYFRTHFGIKVVEYFLSVIKSEAEIGNCPVVFVMIDFFKHKDLPLDDIFMICVHFKNSVTSFIFSRYSFNQELFDNVSLIVDRNFEGVVRNYIGMKALKQEQHTSQKIASVKKETVNSEKENEEAETVTSYAEYVLEHDLYELEDLEDDIDTLSIKVAGNTNVEIDNIVVLGSSIKRYGAILNNYHLFAKLGESIVKLGVAFQTNSEILYESSDKRANIATLLEGFVNDLIVWRKEIFENNIEDPHFLDASFFSNVDTIIMFMEYNESAEVLSTEDDVDFFDF